MEQVRFEKFTLLIDGIHKSIHNLKITIAPYLGVKGVHVLWVWELLKNPDGLTAAELAMRSMVNRSLVSREIEELREGGYVVLELDGGNKYNGKLRLTDKGRELAESIGGVGSAYYCDPKEYVIRGMQMSANHVKAAKVGTYVYATATIIHKGRQTHVWNIDIKNEDGDLVSSCRLTNFVFKP